jgi:hypothetical protein
LLSSIAFESDSELTRIESEAFAYSTLTSITIPRNVEFLDVSAFFCTSKISISIDPDNLHFAVRSNFVFDSSLTRLIRYFGQESDVIIPSYVEVLCSSCFSHFHSISSISFEKGSTLARIEYRAFAHSSLCWIDGPGSIRFIAEDAFPDGCIVNIGDERESREWRRVRDSGFSSRFDQTRRGKRGLETRAGRMREDD